MEAYLHGTSARKVDDLVKALGADSRISRSEVSRICADLDTEVAAFRDRPLVGQLSSQGIVSTSPLTRTR
jgi:putative transposase